MLTQGDRSNTELVAHVVSGGTTVKARPYNSNRLKAAIIRIIRGTDVPLAAIRRAFLSLPAPDRDCLPYVPKLLAFES